MKKIILLTITFIAISLAGQAQVEPHAIGLRFGGGNFGGGAELNYLHGISDANRVELGLGINSLNGGSYMSITGVYQWVFELEQGFSWYAGPGARLLLVSNASAIMVGGEIGAEYNFNTELVVPLQVSLSTRPMFNIGDGDGFGWGIALGVHYTF
jgi:hypothetical protein